MTVLFKGALGSGAGGSLFLILLGLLAIAAVIYVIYSLIACGFLFTSAIGRFMNESDNDENEFGLPKGLNRTAFVFTILLGFISWFLVILWSSEHDGLVWLPILWAIGYIIAMIRFWDWFPCHVIGLGRENAKKEYVKLVCITGGLLVASIVLLAVSVHLLF